MTDTTRKTSHVKAVKASKNKRKRTSKIFASPNKGKFFHTLGKALGVVTMLAGGLTFLALGIRNYNHGIGFSYTNYFYGMVFLGGLIIYIIAYSASKRMARFRYYRTFLEDREYMCLSEIADMTGRKINFLQRDLWKMIQKKLFLQGHMNEQGTCLFLTEEMYQRYMRGEAISGLNVMDNEENSSCADADGRKCDDDFTDAEADDEDYIENEGKSSRESETRDNAPTASTTGDGGEENMESFETECDTQLILMDSLIHQISDKQIKAAAADICVRGKQIMYYKDTEMGADVERFLLYYLPAAKTVLETYGELEQQEMEEQATDLKDILNTIQHSFDTFVEKLMEGKRMDVEADIAAVEMTLSQIL